MAKRATWQDQNIVDELAQLLRNEGIVVSTTDTILGLLAPLTQLGRRKLDEIKHRNDKPYLILMSDTKKISLFCDQAQIEKVQHIIDTYWPGPLTIIMPAKKDLASYLQSPDGTVALRVPDHAKLHELLTYFDGLFSTSANLAGHPVPLIIDHIDQSIHDEVDAIITDQHANTRTLASTIIDCTGEQIKVVRQGAINIS